jgi:RHS repeat-associated protein
MEGTLRYDIENRLVEAGELYGYSPDNRRVYRQTGANREIHFYDVTGQLLGIFQAWLSWENDQTMRWYSWSLQTNTYFGGRLLYTQALGDWPEVVLEDRLGSVRKRRVDSNGREVNMSYYPYGEERTTTAQGHFKFATYFRDATGFDYADQRYYDSRVGRFLTADPYKAGTGSGDPADPQSWNRYAYVQNDPVNFWDPGGLCTASAGTDFCFSTTGTASAGSRPGGGGASARLKGPMPIPDLLFTGEPTVHLPGGGGGASSSPSLSWLLAAAIERVQADLNKPDCAKDFKSASAASSKAGSVGFSNQGELQYVERDGTIMPKKRSPGVARYNPFTGSINLNTQVDWRDPGNTFAVLNGSAWTVNLLAGQAKALGVSTVTAQQFMDLTILHELSHYNGSIGNPDKNRAVEEALWTDCIQ